MSKSVAATHLALLICLSSWFSRTHPRPPRAPRSMDRSNAANRPLRLPRGNSSRSDQRLRQTDYMEEVERLYFTLTGKVPSEEVVEKMISEGKREKLLKTAICSSGRGKVTETWSEIQDGTSLIRIWKRVCSSVILRHGGDS